jgi:hypothetical protein
MVGDREDVEAVPPVEVAQLSQAERTVTPGGVSMQLAEQRTGLRLHPPT